jgi:hypothetical protein
MWDAVPVAQRAGVATVESLLADGAAALDCAVT